MTHIVHVFPALPSGMKDKPRMPKRADKPLHRCKTLPTKTIAEVRWLYEHGFPPTFLAQIYGLTYNHTMQIGQSTIARKV